MIAAVIDAKSVPLTADDQRSAAQRQADALVDVFGFVADHGDDQVLPSAGGQRPHVTVTVQLSDLENRARAACLDLGGSPSPGQLRALCCDAAVIPVVLDGAGQPLDVGRSQRTIPAGLRRAVVVRDGGCAWPGCDRAPSWSECHHMREWPRGGATRLTNLVMVCRVHHREIHATDWIVRVAADGIPEFIPRRGSTRTGDPADIPACQLAATRPPDHPTGDRPRDRHRLSAEPRGTGRPPPGSEVI